MCAPSARTGPTISKWRSELQRRIAAIPGIADAHLQQEVDGPAFEATIDRTRARAAWAERQYDRQQHQCELELIAAGHSPISGPIPPPASRITSRCRRRNIGRIRSNDLRNTPVSTRAVAKRQPNPRHALATWSRSRATACPPTPTRPTSSRSRHLCQHAGPPISAAWRTEIEKVVAELKPQLKPGNYIAGRGPDPEHGRQLPRSRHRHPVRRRVRVPAHGGELSEASAIRLSCCWRCRRPSAASS